MTERATPTLGEVVEVAEVETVVRLDGRTGRLADLVLTGDVVRSLSSVLAAAGRELAGDDAGAAFFVVGPFGSGKSHFLAAVGELLADPGAALPPGFDAAVPHRSETPRSVAVPVPLVEHRATAALEDVVAERAWRAAGVARPPSAGTDRVATWNAVLDAAGPGLVLLLDELSEFLRAKQGAALTEDLRFLQFLGEWTRGRPVVVVAALQESIEEVANVSQRELARIRDRYRPSLALTMRHVEDLVRGRLVRLRPGGEDWVGRAWERVSAAFPTGDVTWERFARCYPIHPLALTLLEGLRFVLSQQRGVVDFVSHRLQGAVQRPFDELITPDEIFDHFHRRLLERTETARLADTVVPYFERTAPELVDPDDVALANRAVKLLCLLAASPVERPRSAAELGFMLLSRVSDLDASANVAYLEDAVLAPLVAGGAYLVARPSAGERTFSVELEADAAIVARARVAQARADLRGGDRRVVATLADLGSSPTLPLRLLREVGTARREVIWQNTLRHVVVGTSRLLDLSAEEATEQASRARATGAEACLLVAEVEPDEAEGAAERASELSAGADRLAIWLPTAPTPEERASLLDLHARRLVTEQARREGREDLVAVLSELSVNDEAAAREILRRIYFAGSMAYSPPPGRGQQELDGGLRGPDLASLAGTPFDRLLVALVDPLLSARHPMHRSVAPRGDLVGERQVRELVTDVIAAGRLGPVAAARGQLRSLVESYLVPLGLARVRSDGITIDPDATRSAAVAEALRLVGTGQPVMALEVAAALADGPVGLTTPETLLVLNACVQAGQLEAWRGRKRTDEPFLAIGPSDRLGAGELVEQSVRQAVAAMKPICGPGPFEPWTADVQRRAWDAGGAWLGDLRRQVAEVRAGLARCAETPALAAAATGQVGEDVAAAEAVLEAVGEGDVPATEGLRRLVAGVDDAAAKIRAARRLAAVARFLRDDFRRVGEAAAYLTHPDLVLPEGFEQLESLRTGAITALAEVLDLAAADRVGEWFAVEREFRSSYTASYAEGHDAHYGAVTARDVEKVTLSAEYRALAWFSEIRAIAVADDRLKVDRLLARVAPPPCRVPLETELLWKPSCRCGYRLGTPVPVLDVEAVLEVAHRGVEQYLAELAASPTRHRLEAAAGDLQRLGRSELAGDVVRLVGLASRKQPPDAGELAAALAGDLPRVLGDVLTGGQLIVTRDLATLRAGLAGRRYPKHKLLQLLETWLDPDGEVPAQGFVEVVDSSEAPPASVAGEHSTVAVLTERFPSLAAVLPGDRAADAFWMAAWWAEREAPPTWLPPALLAEPALLAAAADAAAGGSVALAELADLDVRAAPHSVLGDQMAAALAPGSLSARALADALAGERLLRHPVRLLLDALFRHVIGDWSTVEVLPDLDAVAVRHALLAPGDTEAAVLLATAAKHLAALERMAPAATIAELVEVVYPTHGAPVAALLSRASVSIAGDVRPLVEPAMVEQLRAAAARTLRSADARFEAGARDEFTGCLRIWEVGERVVAPLLAAAGRVAVLLVDAMRADVAARLEPLVLEVLAGRAVERHWAVVPEPTRTAEAVAALSLGRPAPAGSGAPHPGDDAPPFAHLGYETSVLVGADRDHHAGQLAALWESGPPISVAVATVVDERLHRTSVEVAGLIDDVTAALGRRIVPSLARIPSGVPLVVLADHGFRENPRWGQGPEGRYVHGGTSLEECVVPVMVFR